jgi:YD repeat-containing protein
VGSTLTTDETGRETRTAFSRHGVDKLWDPLGNQWQYDYDAADQLKSIEGPFRGGPGDEPAVQPETATRSWTRDLLTGHLLTETSPEAGMVTYEHYNAAGQVDQKRDANDTEFTYGYDNNHRLYSITATKGSAPNTETVQTTIEYEPGSDLIHKTTRSDSTAPGTVETTFGYDGAGRAATRSDTIDGRTFLTTATYDGEDNLIEIDYPSGRRVRYAYDAQGRLQRVYNVDTGQNYASAFTYHGSGALNGFTSGNGVATRLTLDPKRYRLTSIEAGPAASPILKFAYTYYDTGNVHTLKEGTTNETERTFTYDELDRLKTASATGPDANKYPYTQYAFDGHGNRITAGSGQPYTYYPDHFRLKTIGDPQTTAPFEYDDNGNLTTGPLTGGTGIFTYSYRPDNLLSRAVTAAGTTDFAYDGGALRIKRAVAGGATSYFVKGPDGRLLSEWTPGTGNAVTAHDYIYAGGQLIGVATKTFQLGQ